MVKTTRKQKKCDGDIVIKKRNAVLSKSYLTRNQKQLMSKSSSFKEKCTKSNIVSNSNQDKSAKTDSNVSKLDTQIRKNISDNVSSPRNDVFRKTAEKLKESKQCSVVIKQKDIILLTNNQKLSKKSLVQKRDAKCNKFNSVINKSSKVELNDSNLIIQSDKTHLSKNCASKKAKIDKISTKSKVCNDIGEKRVSSPWKLNETKNKKLNSKLSLNQRKCAEKCILDLNKYLKTGGDISVFDIQNANVFLHNINLPRNDVPGNRKIIKTIQKSNKNISYSATRSKKELSPKLQKTNNQKLVPDMLEENSVQEICANSVDSFNSNEDKFVNYKSNILNFDPENSKNSLNDENSSQNVFSVYSQADKNVHLKDLRIICQKLDISNYKSNCVKNTLNTNNEKESVHFKQNKTMITNENEESNNASHLNKTTDDSIDLSNSLDIDKNATEISLEEAVITEEKLIEIKSEDKVYGIASPSFSVVRRNIHESLEIDKTEINSEGNIENESVTMKSALQRKHLRSPSWIKDYDEEFPQFESNANCAMPEALSTNKRTWCVLS